MRFYELDYDPERLAVGIDLMKHPRIVDNPAHGAWDMAYACWYRLKKPYYSVYPSIIPLLTKVKLDIPTKSIVSPLPFLLIRMPVENNLLTPVKTILIGNVTIGMERKNAIQNIFISIHTTEDQYLTTVWENTEDITVEEVLQDIPDNCRGTKPSDVLVRIIPDVLKLICSLCLLDNDPSIMEPDVLDKDKGRYEWGDDAEKKFLEERAKRRGKVGWNVGRKIEMIPHYRRPHFGWRWTGNGRTIPKIVRIKGSIVHRELVSKIPTGYGS